MMFYEIPLSRPNTPLLDSVPYPSDLRKLSLNSLPRLADELRAYLLWCTGQTGCATVGPASGRAPGRRP